MTGRPHPVWAELTKLATLRSVWITTVTLVAVVVLAGWLQAGVIGEAMRTHDPTLAPGTTPETVGFEWVPLGLVGIVVIGVVAAGSEYTAGQIATSLLASPDRFRLFLAKVAALALLVGGVGVVTVPAVSLLSQHGLGDLSVVADGLPRSLVLRWLGAVGFWIAMALLSFAAAVLLRQTLIPLFALVVVSQLSLLLLLLTPKLAYLPTIAGVELFDPGQITGSHPAAALGVPIAAALTAGWTVVLLAVAGYRFVRRDT